MEDRLANERPGPAISPASALPLLAVAAVTTGWWALALWPVPADAAGWVARTRAVCFGARDGGLPDAAGWVALVVQPGVMAAMVIAIWGRPLRTAARTLVGTRRGRVSLVAIATAVLVVTGLAVLRLTSAADVEAAAAASTAGSPLRLDREAPPLVLTDQHGRSVDLSAFRGRLVLVTFAFGHCETVCPLVVSNAVAVARRAAEEPVVFVVTVDPWRDTPSRLPNLAARWELEGDAYALSGTVAAVGAVLDAWDVRRSRNLKDGSIVHGALTYVVDRAGRIAYATSGSEAALGEAIASLEEDPGEMKTNRHEG